MHNNYFKRTLSHSAPMLDGVCQTESKGTGPATVEGSLGDVQISKLTTDPLNEGNRLRRTMFMIGDDDGNDEYPVILDINEALIENKSEISAHFFDVITHSESTQYSLKDSNGNDVSVSSVTQSMGSDVSWQYLTSLKKTESKEVMTGTWDWGHSVRHQFDRTDEWSGMELSKDRVKTGSYSMRWKNHLKPTSVSTTKYMTDWSDVDRVTLTLYNAVSNTEKMYFIIYSENASSSGIDYYYYIMPLNWTGWKTYNWTKSDFKISRWPMGWNAITGMIFSSSWSNTQQESSDVYFDSMMFWDKKGVEIDGRKGLEQHLPKVSYDRTTFYDLNAPSNPTSKRHAVNIIRQNAKNPVVQVLRPLTGTNFITSFTQSGKSYVIKTKTETITVNPGDVESDVPCATVTRKSNKKGTVTSYLGWKEINLFESEVNLTVLLFPEEDNVMSFQTENSTPVYNATEKTVVFDRVKAPGKKKIGINVTACSKVDGLTVFINGIYADVVGKKKKDKNGCVIKSFSTNLNLNPSVMGNLTVVLKDLKKPSSASHIRYSVVLFLIFFLIYLI